MAIPRLCHTVRLARASIRWHSEKPSVPGGDKRVPAGATEFPVDAQSATAATTDFGPAVAELQARRAALAALKKALGAVQRSAGSDTQWLATLADLERQFGAVEAAAAGRDDVELEPVAGVLRHLRAAERADVAQNSGKTAAEVRKATQVSDFPMRLRLCSLCSWLICARNAHRLTSTQALFRSMKKLLDAMKVEKQKHLASK